MLSRSGESRRSEGRARGRASDRDAGLRRYVTNPFAEWLFVEGTWMVFDPTTKIVLETECPSAAAWRALSIVTELCSEPRFESEITDHLERSNLRHADAMTTFSSARELGLLIDEADVGIWHRRAAAAPSRHALDAIRYLALRPYQEYFDYSRPTIHDEDRRIMRRYIERGSPPPPLVKEYAGLPRIELPHPLQAGAAEATSSPALDPCAKLSHLLFLAFGALRESTFLGVLKRLLKPVPSMGARHPLEAYLLVGEGACIGAGVYHYEVMHSALTRIAPPDASIAPGITLVITAVFERSQWRYRHNFAYKDVLHDLGHATGTVKMTAEELQIALAELDDLPEWRYTPPLEEEPMAAFRIVLDAAKSEP